jgi:hypothetical protein
VHGGSVEAQDIAVSYWQEIPARLAQQTEGFSVEFGDGERRPRGQATLPQFAEPDADRLKVHTTAVLQSVNGLCRRG